MANILPYFDDSPYGSLGRAGAEWNITPTAVWRTHCRWMSSISVSTGTKFITERFTEKKIFFWLVHKSSCA